MSTAVAFVLLLTGLVGLARPSATSVGLRGGQGRDDADVATSAALIVLALALALLVLGCAVT